MSGVTGQHSDFALTKSMIMKIRSALAILLMCTGYQVSAGHADDTDVASIVYPTFRSYSLDSGVKFQGALALEKRARRKFTGLVWPTTEHAAEFVWGVKEGKTLYRYFNDRWYKVADTSGLVVYYGYELSTFPHVFDILTLSYKEKDYVVEKCYFSVSLDAPIILLSKKEVLSAVNDHVFTENVKQEFGIFKDIAAESSDDVFLINEVYRRSFTRR